MPVPPSVMPLSPALLGRAAEVLALAFAPDPIARYVLPDAARRARVLRWMFQTHLRDGLRYGEVYTTEGAEGVALWLTPGRTNPTFWRLLRAGALVAPLQFGWQGCQRSVAFMADTTAWHRQYAPDVHWYLFYLGVTPAQQGHGIGSALLQPVLARADAAHLPCYLETGVARNLELYARHGFVCVAEGALPQGGPPLWAMLRAPRLSPSLAPVGPCAGQTGRRVLAPSPLFSPTLPPVGRGAARRIGGLGRESYPGPI